MNDLMMEKGFSRTDNKYFLFFKKRPLIYKPQYDNSINNLISSNYNKNSMSSIEKPSVTTNKKLNLIIFNLEQKKNNLREKFFNEKKAINEYDSFHMKIKELLKSKNLIEKKEIIVKNDRLNGIRESIKNLIKFKKKYALDENFVKIKLKENNKTPPLCNYNPNLNSINKHTPFADLSGHHHKSLIKIKKQNQNYLNNHGDIIILNEERNNETKNVNKINNNNNQDIFISINNKMNYSKSINSMSRLNYSKNIEKKRRPISKSNSMELSPINSYKKKSNISVPIFNKMISRDKNNYLYKNIFLGDYFPNYDSIYSNANKYISINKELKKKKNKLRKIISCSNPPGEYLLLPSLNNI